MSKNGKVSEKHWKMIKANFLLYVEFLCGREFLVVSTDGKFFARVQFDEGRFMHLTGVCSSIINAHKFFSYGIKQEFDEWKNSCAYKWDHVNKTYLSNQVTKKNNVLPFACRMFEDDVELYVSMDVMGRNLKCVFGLGDNREELTFTMGFIKVKSEDYYVPNTLLDKPLGKFGDIHKIDFVFSRMIGDPKFTEMRLGDEEDVPELFVMFQELREFLDIQ